MEKHMQRLSEPSSDFLYALEEALCWQKKTGWQARDSDLDLAARIEARWGRKKRRFSMTHILYRCLRERANSEEEVRHRVMLLRLVLEAVFKAGR
ncbi:hypothetical protein CO608_03190 [Lysobacteraceae bacterium NML08-0793]|nr:hypothetical protein CO608_03190 [Xanthomonadaceae bacterium NML08-0793]